MSHQLALNIQLQDDATFQSFFPGQNAAVLQSLHLLAKNLNERLIYLWGNSGVGLSHLLQATCQEANLQSHTALYLPLEQMSDIKEEDFQGLENINIIALDNIDTFLSAKKEEMLFHLYNRILNLKNCLIVAAHVSPHGLPFQLADLKSRLTSGLTYQLQNLEDEEKIQTLILRAKARGLELSSSVAQFLLSRAPRELTALFGMLEVLDKASLAEQRRLTVPFVKAVLGL